MDVVLRRGGQLIGLLGLLLMLVSGVARVSGLFWLGGMATGTLMIAGIAGAVAGCFLLLWFIADRR
jgi:hypothetical protein